MKKVTVIGHFGTETSSSDGQTIKTKTIAKALEKKYGTGDVIKVDTHGGLRTLIKAYQIVKTAFQNSENVIILPAENGLMVFAPLCAIQKQKHSSVKLHYVVVGGWLPKFIQKHKSLEVPLKQFDGIYVETSTMKISLERMGFTNTVVMPNCKDLTILSEEDLVYSTGEPLKLCTFSRVMREKGIEDAINAVTIINRNYGRTVYTLDIYGQIDPNQKDWFEKLEKSFPPYIQYQGVISYDNSTNILKEYYLLLFPTYYEGEGFAGTIIDAMSAGIPVIASNWKYNSEIICDGINGFLCEPCDVSSVISVLCELIDTEKANIMKREIIKSAQRFQPEKALEVLIQRMED